jgi:histidinol-phosphate/aromatic aminotransferase/cobyric acid decarboxylase-like protein
MALNKGYYAMFLSNPSGKEARKKEELLNISDIIRLDGTRCPYPPPASVLTVVQDCATGSLREVEKAKELAKAVAELFGVSEANICVCCCPAAAYACEGINVRDRSALLREEQADLRENTVHLYDLGRCFGLPGVNAWALIAPKETASALAAICARLKISPPDRVASAAVLAAISDPENVEKWRSMVENTLRRAQLLLNENGFVTTVGEGPYLDIKIPAPNRAFLELLQCGIAVGTGKGHIRVWAGTEEEMERFYYCLFKMKERILS